MSPTSTIIITGGTGVLGSAIARSLEASYAKQFHLILTCRNTADAHAVSISDFLKSKDGSFALERLDLSDLNAVQKFAESVKSRIAAGSLPAMIGGGIVNSAASMTFMKEAKTKDDLDMMYTTNCLAPTLLMRCFVPVMMEGATVVNVGSEAHALGKVEYFQEQEDKNRGAKEGEKLGLVDGMKRYGASKLLCAMMGYAFQRRLFKSYPSNKIHIFTVDPGSMNAGGRLLGDEHSWVLPFLANILSILGHFLRLFRKEAINDPSVPAKAIADLLGSKDGRNEVWKGGKYYVLDDEKKSSALSLDEKRQDEVWKIVCDDLSLDEDLP